MQVNLDSGNLSANIPEKAKGFTVITNAAKVIDLGTEFSIKANEFQSEVHVFKGEVVISSTEKGAESLHLYENQASRLDINSTDPVGIDTNPDGFLRSLDEPKHFYPNKIRKLKPLSYYRMRPNHEGVFEDVMRQNNGIYIHGKGRKSSWAPGRFGASFRCEGRGAQRYAKVAGFPITDNGRFSITAWIYADSRPRRGTIAKIGSMKNDGLFSLGLFRKTGELKGHIGSITGKEITVKSPYPIEIKKWQHVVLTADGSKLKLYINGESVAETSYNSTNFNPKSKTLGVGACISTDTAQEGHSVWDGRIDELAVFDYALDAGTIKEIYSIQPVK